MMNLTASNKPGRAGTCQLCGGHGRELKILAIGDFWGWACEQCVREVGESLPRRYLPGGEQTEPSE